MPERLSRSGPGYTNRRAGRQRADRTQTSLGRHSAGQCQVGIQPAEVACIRFAIGGLDTALTLRDAHTSFRLPTPVPSKFAALERPAYRRAATGAKPHSVTTQGEASSPTADYMLII